jgi:hypothetical protein
LYRTKRRMLWFSLTVGVLFSLSCLFAIYYDERVIRLIIPAVGGGGVFGITFGEIWRKMY